jgi:CDP-diacylglycerol--glycerol-3-phosphate 3-phosphatidyltransferase
MKHLINFLTWFRVISGPAIFILILIFNQYGTSLVLFIMASLSDYFDGYLARRYNCESSFGEVLDPIADKILTLFLILTLTLFFQSYFIGFIGALILSREFWVSALRDMNARQGNVSSTAVSLAAKFKTSLQFIAFASYLIGIFLGNALLIFLSDFVLFAAFIITIYTGSLYTMNSFQLRKTH